MLRSALVATIPFAFLTAAAAGQSITVRGRVMERGSSESVAGADLLLSGARTSSNGKGEFLFTRVQRGTRTLTVTMLGYQRRDIELNVRADTALVIELDVEALQLDSVTVRGHSYTVRGELLERSTNAPIADAEVLIGQNRRAVSNTSGRFRITRLTPAESVTLMIRAPGFLVSRTTIAARADTALHIELEPDQLARRLLARQVEELQERVRSSGLRSRVLGREELNKESIQTAYDLVRRQTGYAALNRVACVMVDEQRMASGLQQLHLFNSDQLERIEIIDSGTMVRVYTRRYIVQMMRRQDPLGPILLMGDGRRYTCA